MPAPRGSSALADRNVTQTEQVSAAPVSSDPTSSGVGDLMRHWRRRRRLSQLELAVEAEVSSRHVSFIETGRTVPSRTMILRLATALEVPPREQNRLLLAAGWAPEYSERPLDAADMAAVRAGIDQVLAAYEPYPCLVVDRGWNIVTANAATAVLLDGVAPALLEQPNALRIALHPDGLAPRIDNLGQWRHHLLERLRREALTIGTGTGSAESAALLQELEAYPGAPDSAGPAEPVPGPVAVPLRLRMPDGAILSLLSMITTFGTAVDLTAAELSFETFLPADPQTAALLTAPHPPASR